MPRSIESDGATTIPDVHQEEGHNPTTSLTTLTGAALAGLIAGAGCGGGGSSRANAATWRRRPQTGTPRPSGSRAPCHVLTVAASRRDRASAGRGYDNYRDPWKEQRYAAD